VTVAEVPWRPGTDPRSVARAVALAHERFVTGAEPGGIRPLVLDSWRRSLRSGVDPDAAQPPVDLTDDELAAYRDAHPLAPIMPIIRRLLVDSAADTGLIVAITDAHGRLLWVEGETRLRSRTADAMNFVEGARWDEAAAGTNAPGTALALDREVQIFASEHFARNVAAFSCSAAPIHDPETGALLGALDVTGGDAVVSPQVSALVRATVAAAEAELRLHRLLPPAAVRTPQRGHRLDVLGRDNAVLSRGSRAVRLSLRHSELLLALTRHPEGLSADQLAVLLYDADPAGVTVRAEMARLRTVVADLGLASRPYRLLSRLTTDAEVVRELLEQGSVRRALVTYHGPVLPRSDAPVVTALRAELSGHLRAAVLASRNPDLLLDYARTPDGAADVETWETTLTALPAVSPRRAAVVAHLEQLDRDLG
jgi:transcriptional regulator of acetoin/glycerol metabolism